MWVVNVSVVTLLPSNEALMGPNGLPIWLCNRLECLFVLNGPVSPSGMTDPFTRQCTFVLVASSKMCVCSLVLSVSIVPNPPSHTKKFLQVPLGSLVQDLNSQIWNIHAVSQLTNRTIIPHPPNITSYVAF